MNSKIYSIGGMGTTPARSDAHGDDSGATSDVSQESQCSPAAWSGKLDEEELRRPGGVLPAALVHCAKERGQQLNDMAKDLGVTYGYISQLRTGIRPTNQISDLFAQSCAAYLGLPRLAVLMMAGKVTSKDLFMPDITFSQELAKAMEYISSDPEWGAIMTAKLRKADDETKFFIVKLYQKATGRVLLPAEFSPDRFLEELDKLSPSVSLTDT